MLYKYAAVIALLAGAIHFMGNSSSQQKSTLIVTGQGATEVQPDIAKVILNVQSTKPLAKTARDEAAVATGAVQDAIDAVDGVSRDDITTLDVSVQPQYTWNEAEHTQKITGYQFNQRIQVKVLNLSNDVLGAVIDAAVRAGGNNLLIETIQAELSPEVKRQAVNVARKAAVASAKEAAEVLSQAAGITVGSIKTFSDSGPLVPSPHVPMAAAFGGMMKQDAMMSTPVNIGTTSVAATVTMEFFIGSQA